MDEHAVRALIRKQIVAAGSLRNLAAQWNLSPTLLSDTLNGRRGPGDKVLKPLGLVKVKRVTFEKRRSYDDL